MSKSLDQLGLKAEKLPTAGQALEDAPEFGNFAPPPQPGPFRFQLPGDLSSVFDVFDAKDKGQRVKVIFDREHPLLIVQSLGDKYNKLPFETRLTNAERPRGKGGSGGSWSDFDYLLRALGEKQTPADNRGYCTALMAHKGQQFGADLTYSWACSKDRDIRVKDEAGATQVVENQKGCGMKYYQQDVEKLKDGTTPYEITCQCGAVVRAFANLENFRA